MALPILLASLSLLSPPSLPIDIDFDTLRIVVAPAETLAVTVEGAGSPVVVIPGLLGGAWGFRHVTGPLVSVGRRVVVVEPLGTGRSSRPEEADYSFAAQSQRVAAVLDTLGLSAATLIVHDVGGPVGYRLAIARPDLVSGIVSIHGAPAEQLDTNGVNSVLRFAPILRLFGASGRARGKLESMMRESSWDPAWVTDEVVDRYGAAYSEDLWGTLRILQRMSKAENPDSLAPMLDRIAAPVVLLRSANRPQSLSQAETDLLAATIPDIAVRAVDRTGQYVQEERPDAVVDAVFALSINALDLRVGSR